MALRWGIVSAGKISSDFVNSLEVLSKSDHKVVAVAARSLASAQSFAKAHDIAQAYEGYTALAEDGNVDIVYVGNLNPQHFEVSKMMLEHGKHVLCEKPFTMNEKQTRALIKIAQAKKLFLMEAIWSRCFPAYEELRKIIESGGIGDVLQVNASFGFNLQDVARLQTKELGGGTILDLGVYVLQFQQFVFKGETPTNMLAVGGINNEGCDEYTNSIWVYPKDKVAVLSTSAKAALSNEAIVVGTKGIIRVPSFWCPTSLIVNNETYEFPPPNTTATFNFPNAVGLCYEAEHARQCIKAGQIESFKITHAESIQLAHHMDSLRKAVGVSFAEDDQDF